MNLDELVTDVTAALAAIDASRKGFRAFQAGVGPYGEPHLVRLIADYLNQLANYHGTVRTKRCPDLLIPNEWAVEFKITRPFGDNGKEAENWSVNLLLRNRRTFPVSLLTEPLVQGCGSNRQSG